MRINNKILSIPPYISTSWKNIASLYVTEREGKNILMIVLFQGSCIEIPDLEQPIIEAIFAAHAKFSEQEPSASKPRAPQRGPLPQNSLSTNTDAPFNMAPQFRIDIRGIEGLGSILQHNPEHAASPNLPQDILMKITSLSKVMGIDDPSVFPKGEPHCNCMHCQIAKALHGEMPETLALESQLEEVVTEEDLKFRLWDIKQTAEKLYVVSNPLDAKEYYNVYLGDSVGCTCGSKNCEHIRAVLNS